jgi:hypothetical protein
MSKKYKKDLDDYIKGLDSPVRKSYHELMKRLEKIVNEYNQSDEKMPVLINRVSKILREYEQQELPFSDILTAVGVNIRDFKELSQSAREDKVRDRFIDAVYKGKRADWFNDFEKKWVEIERKEKEAEKKHKPKKSSPKKSSPRKSSPKKSDSQQKKPPRRVVPIYLGPVDESKNDGRIAELSLPVLKARVIAGEAIPARELVRAIDMSDKVLMANVLKSRPSSNKRRSPSAKSRPPSNKRRSPSAKSRPPSNKRRSPSANRRSPKECPVGCIRDPRKPCKKGQERGPSGHCRSIKK